MPLFSACRNSVELFGDCWYGTILLPYCGSFSSMYPGIEKKTGRTARKLPVMLFGCSCNIAGLNKYGAQKHTSHKWMVLIHVFRNKFSKAYISFI